MSILCRLLPLGIVLLGLSSCANKQASLGFLSVQDRLDTSLPQVAKVRTLADVSAIAFEWDKVANTDAIKGFAIFQIINGTPKKIAVIKNPYATHYVISSLRPETSYAFQIATIGAEHAISNKTRIINVKTSFIDPVETGIASTDYAKQIKLIWSPHPNPSITRYLIQRKGPDGRFLTIGTVKNRMLVEYFDEDLPDEQEFTYRIIAQDFYGIRSRPSADIKGATKHKPKSISFMQASQHLAKQIQLSWEAIPNAVRYEIYTSSSINGVYKPLAQVNKNTYTHKVGKDSVELFYKVRAIDASNVASDLSAQAARGATLPPPPTPHLLVGELRGSQAFIEWDMINNTRVKSYAIYRYEGRAGNPLRFSNMLHTSFTDKDMQRGKRYAYRVVSVDNDGNESMPSKAVELALP